LKIVGPDRIPKLVITAGDVRGIGPEVVAKALSHPEVRKWAEYLVVGPEGTFSGESTRETIAGISLEPVEIAPAITAGKPDIRIARLAESGVPAQSMGRSHGKVPEDIAGKWAGESIDVAVRMIENGEGDVLITAPVDKKALMAGGYPYAGHTGMLKALTNSPRVTMMLTGGLLRVSLVTVHVPLREIWDRLGEEEIKGTVQHTIDALREYFGISSPRIAICGLNPHIGEGGRLGGEENEIIEPVVKRFLDAGQDVSGPYPADTVFTMAISDEFDAVVAMYHDQGLGPFKLHSFGRGVNMTLGLPFIRTSVDHGTAMDIAGEGVANERSMIHAIRIAREIFLRCGENTRFSFDN
jgi:4-hydroxythreonine-4-phosphate dehydrogenase